MAKGKKTGGRKKGSVNHPNRIRAEGLTDLIRRAKDVCDQILVMSLPCSVCRGKGKSAFQAGSGKEPGLRICQSCWGSGKEKITPELRAKVALETLEYGHPRLKSIEHTGVDGGPIQLGIRVVSVKPGQ